MARLIDAVTILGIVAFIGGMIVYVARLIVGSYQSYRQIRRSENYEDSVNDRLAHPEKYE